MFDAEPDRIEYLHHLHDNHFGFEIYLDNKLVARSKRYGNRDQRDAEAKKAFDNARRRAGKLIGG